MKTIQRINRWNKSRLFKLELLWNFGGTKNGKNDDEKMKKREK